MRNTIVEIWKANKPYYFSKTLAKQKLKKCGTAKEIGQVHKYLEHRGYINFGCGMIIVMILVLSTNYQSYLISGECKYHKNVKKEQFKAKTTSKMQYNLKPPILHGKSKSLKKVNILNLSSIY